MVAVRASTWSDNKSLKKEDRKGIVEIERAPNAQEKVRKWMSSGPYCVILLSGGKDDIVEYSNNEKASKRAGPDPELMCGRG